MLEFKKLQLGDIEKLRPYFHYSQNRICDNTVGGAFMWRDYFSVEYAEYNETIVFKARVKYRNNITAFSVPLGKDVRGSIGKTAEYCGNQGIPLAFCTVTDEDIKVLQTVFSDFQLSKEADWSDYMYRTADLVTLSGRRYNGQRNHLNFFRKTYADHSFEEITDANIGIVRDFYTRISSMHSITSDIAVEDRIKTLEVLDNYSAYGMVGGVLMAGGSAVAFSMGEVVGDVLFVHVEKADVKYRGAYQAVNNEFCKRFALEGVEFVNREEDVGDEGLRMSKKSYHPCEIIDKYIFFVTEMI